MCTTERKSKREKILHNAKQKVFGVICLLTVLAECVMANANLIDEGGSFIFMLPLGLYLLITKERVVW